MLHSKFQPNIPSGSGEVFIFIGFAIFSYCSHYYEALQSGLEVIKLFSMLNSAEH